MELKYPHCLCLRQILLTLTVNYSLNGKKTNQPAGFSKVNVTVFISIWLLCLAWYSWCTDEQIPESS